MRLACNYYEETERLAREGRIAVDCFKYPSLGFQMKAFDDPGLAEYGAMAARVREYGPLLLHGLGQRDNGPILRNGLTRSLRGGFWSFRASAGCPCTCVAGTQSCRLGSGSAS